MTIDWDFPKPAVPKTIDWSKPIRFVNGSKRIVRHQMIGDAHLIYWDVYGTTYVRQVTKNGDSMESYTKMVENIPEEPKNYIGVYVTPINTWQVSSDFMTKTTALSWMLADKPNRRIVKITDE